MIPINDGVEGKRQALYILQELKPFIEKWYDHMDLTDYEHLIYSLEDDVEEDDGL